MAAPTPSCVLDPAGVAPADFLNPSVVGAATVQALAQRAPRVYGCVQVTSASTIKWFCATTSPKTELASQGRDQGCSAQLNTTNTACTAAWIETLPGTTSATVPISVVVLGCLEDDKGFACSTSSANANPSARVSCTPRASLAAAAPRSPGSTTDPTTIANAADDNSGLGVGAVVGISIGIVAAVLVGAGLFFWHRRRQQNGPDNKELLDNGNNATASPRGATDTAAAAAATAAPSVGAFGSPRLMEQIDTKNGAPGSPTLLGTAASPFAKPATADTLASAPESSYQPLVPPATSYASSSSINSSRLASPSGASALAAAASPPINPATDVNSVRSAGSASRASIAQVPPQLTAEHMIAHRQQLMQQMQTYTDPDLLVATAQASSAAALASPASLASASPAPFAPVPSSSTSPAQLHAYAPAADSPVAPSPMSQVSLRTDDDITPAGRSPAAAAFSFVAPRASLSMETSLPPLSPTPRASSEPGSPSPRPRPSAAASDASGYSTDEEVYPRPYRTYINMEGAAPPVQAVHLPQFVRDGAGAEAGPVVPALPATIATLSRQRYAVPTEGAPVTYLPLAFGLPLTTPLRSDRANMLCAPKMHLPGYNIDDMVTTYDGMQLTLRELVAQSFAHAARLRQQALAQGQTPQPTLADTLFSSVTRGAPVPLGIVGAAANQAAFVARIMHTLVTDVVVAMTSPLKVADHVAFIKKHLPDLKRDLRMPKAANHRASHASGAAAAAIAADTTPGTVSAHLLFVALDHCLGSPSLVSDLMAYLRPIAAHAAANVTAQFHAHGLAPPAPDTVDELVHAFLDWFLRLKREFPGVGMYCVPADVNVDAQWMVKEGGDGEIVAFTTGYGLWDGAAGQVGYFARVWAKTEVVE
ncbi:hypothetical protein AMAG_04342 [Allomyces macrogynus ATCC 38327]|uniref:Uncharacterized protein n=1 Tax=Allomyces macrogynus (strain ATCC 38327) TaxID=578462 RepID=A0A0L0S8P1_ALLM3|nr:hypothetical protein AMAG_04342 [Allomyces macrogynus ATCC 38327]|eukprot:KNE58791.1 hypothetical protein AMAG_04342 [Allomyces macrogynus ATCC 38327]